MQPALAARKVDLPIKGIGFLCQLGSRFDQRFDTEEPKHSLNRCLDNADSHAMLGGDDLNRPRLHDLTEKSKLARVHVVFATETL